MIPAREEDMNNNTFVHKYIRSLITKDDITVDMTAGNGNDTLLLARLSKKVYAFDVSKQAIDNTKERIKDYDNVVLINDSHANAEKYVKEKVRLFIFNLGYLPGSDQTSITKADVTLEAFKKACGLLEKGGYIVITFYLKQKGGLDEYYLLSDHINKNRFQITETYRQDKPFSPITWIIRKISRAH